MRLLPEKARGDRTGETRGTAADMPSRSYGLDLDAQRVRGSVDGEEALKQAITLRLNSWWRAHDIYDDRYGFEAQGLLGKDRAYTGSELKRRLRECLLEDDRIYSVENFRFEDGEEGDGWALSFRVRSCFGEWEIEGMEVRRP